MTVWHEATVVEYPSSIIYNILYFYFLSFFFFFFFFLILNEKINKWYVFKKYLNFFYNMAQKFFPIFSLKNVATEDLQFSALLLLPPPLNLTFLYIYKGCTPYPDPKFCYGFHKHT